MLEKMRERWTKASEPLVHSMGDLNPNLLTWASLVFALAAFFLLARADLDSRGAMAIVCGVGLGLIAGFLDALDGALARHQGVDGPYGDFLDHTIDRVVDVGLLVALGMNAAFVDEFSSGLLAGLLTLFGSYMGTQAQSVGLDRIYGGFSRTDRGVLTVVGLLAAAWQAQVGGTGIDVSEIHEQAHWLLLGNGELNGMTFALAISAWGGVYTFVVRFIRTRNGLLG